MAGKKTLRQLFAEEKVILAPEVYDCASAITCADCGYKALVLSGAEVSLALKGIPDLGTHDGEPDVTLKEIAEYGFNFVGIHYLLGAAMTAMTDAGMGNIARQDNVYAQTKYPRPGIGSKELIKSWYEYERQFNSDQSLKDRWPYNYYKVMKDEEGEGL